MPVATYETLLYSRVLFTAISSSVMYDFFSGHSSTKTVQQYQLDVYL